MFKLIDVEDVVRIPPEKFGKPLKEVAEEELKSKYVGLVNSNLGYVIDVLNVKIDPVGKIIPGDGATYHKAFFTLLTFYPVLQEIVEGDVVDVQDFGAFVRLGPVDALLHMSQIMDDFIAYDRQREALVGRQTGRFLRKGDVVRVRIVAVSLPKTGSGIGKIGVTAKQPFLGKLEWIKEEVAKLHGGGEG
ncbi:DNA-directed RNA polymerase [Candidatus Bathyarchaeota archaeon]|nr:DNA-directed RNA polymerase [Candidatus Bathyarchaeota archaeon]